MKKIDTITQKLLFPINLFQKLKLSLFSENSDHYYLPILSSKLYIRTLNKNKSDLSEIANLNQN